ncbi:DNA-binding helix-turn-helix protein [Leptospira yanagawae serovar Saopaulo str. Sao Paulo = ATCC 700523]|uniref:DNA-binding helix-turn-helix protein n=1 Tax=Leptospira yanagawae serovar Saopaulo str. Sao Paulo = ATCC 700523 TaxID=1249483 RepID=A0A5E8HJ52_9LEPT|nr:helix-turn-helix domain-containing protein [Leptospira yanagawae]EOQ90743.1 DNA-binding helix-turn-helix protein [Leptospira yanagawae serovar Saopaulo str. Sao Paulo = ATCC 700523]
MKAQIRTGVWTPVWIENLKLSHSQTRLLAEIVSLHEKEGCFASNKYLSEILGLKTDTVSRLISELKRRGLLIQTGFDGRRRFLKPIYPKMNTETALEKNPTPVTEIKEKIQMAPIGKSNADSHFDAPPISTIEVQNKVHKTQRKSEGIKLEELWNHFAKWSEERVSPTTWAMIQKCQDPGQLGGSARIFWENWSSRNLKNQYSL